MTLRKISKDHLPRQGADPEPIYSPDLLRRTDSPLRFWTQHARKACLVDLSDLELGQDKPKKPGLEDRWLGGYSGRPTLIHELLPAIKEKLMFATEKTCRGRVADLKMWWRLFDEMEALSPQSGIAVTPVRSVKDLTHLHQQLAVQRFSPGIFSSFRSVADMTRRAQGMRPLPWIGPEFLQSSREIPTQAQSRDLFTQIKRFWFGAIDRWAMVDDMLAKKRAPVNEEQVDWLRNAEYLLPFLEMDAFPTASAIRKFWSRETGKAEKTLSRHGLSTDTMFATLFPTAFEIRMGFHLALIGGGWNVQTLLDLRVKASAPTSESMPFLRDHPQDSNRYIMTGFKERGSSDHFLHGDWKADRSPGKIVRTIVERTWPLRQELVRLLRIAKIKLNQLLVTNADLVSLTEARLTVMELQRKSESVWLYRTRNGIHALDDKNYDKYERNTPVLRIVVTSVNENRAARENLIPAVNASDFRSIFAEYAYRISGGSVLAVQKALGHRSPSMTAKYLESNIIKEQHARIFVTYTNEMWAMVVSSGRLDHTALRQVVETGGITSDQKMRLAEYRKLKKSRLGIGCKDPRQPPSRLDPQFVVNGQSLCTVHRCTLCTENAVIAPEALRGLAMRLAELQHLQSRIPAEHFHRGGEVSLHTELRNTEAALFGFESDLVKATFDAWTLSIEKGLHRVPEFNGVGSTTKPENG